MKIEEQVLSIEQMKHLQELGVDTSDASMCWAGNDVVPNNGSAFDLGYDGIPTYTTGDLIEKLPKYLYIKDSSLYMEAINGSGAFQVGYYGGQHRFTRDGNIKNALYKLLRWVAEKHKELLEEKK